MVYFTEVKLLGDSRNCSCRIKLNLNCARCCALLGEQHVVSGGVIAVEAVVNAVAVVFAG